MNQAVKMLGQAQKCTEGKQPYHSLFLALDAIVCPKS